MKISKKKLSVLQSNVTGMIMETLQNTKKKYEPEWWDSAPDSWSREQKEEWDRLFELSFRIINEIEFI